MSLLLDALKKAARDKQKAAAQSEALPPEPDTEAAAEVELELDEAAPAAGGEAGDSTPPLSLEPIEAHTTTSTVSDEALHMLVFKTNREYRRKQKMVWSAVAAGSVLVLLLGGYYFYDDMVQDIESLERKHRIAIQKVNAEVVRQKRPELIADLTDRAVVDDPSPATDTAAAAAATEKPASAAAAATARATARPAAPQIIRSTRADPVPAMLQQAWQAYNRADYASAARLYQQVLQREAGNRDALLGQAAIAMKQSRLAEARQYYARLLQQDPRDPVAVAAMTSLKTATGAQANPDGSALSELDESRLKRLLRQQPDNAPVNFALGNISAKQKQWPQAQAYYFRAWMADDSNPDYAFNLAVSLDRIGKPQQARRFYRRSLELAAGRNPGFSTDVARARLQALEGEQ